MGHDLLEQFFFLSCTDWYFVFVNGTETAVFSGYSLESKDELVDALPTLKKRAAEDDANILFSVASDLSKVKTQLSPPLSSPPPPFSFSYARLTCGILKFALGRQGSFEQRNQRSLRRARKKWSLPTSNWSHRTHKLKNVCYLWIVLRFFRC